MNSDKLEGYMINLGLTFQKIADNSWIINDEEKGLERLIVIYEDPLIIIRVKVMEKPEKNREAFYEKLLSLNAEDIMHGAYALEGNDIIMTDTLEYSTMDLEEFQASLDAIGLALAQHYSILSEFRNN